MAASDNLSSSQFPARKGEETPEMTAVLGPKVRKNVLQTRGVGEGLSGYHRHNPNDPRGTYAKSS